MRLNPTNIAIIKRLLVGRNSRPLLSILSRLEPADLASLFSQINDRESRLLVDALMAIDKASQVLAALPAPQLVKILETLDQDTTAGFLASAPEEDAAYFLSVLETGRQEELLGRLPPVKRRRIHQCLHYPEGCAGRIMQPYVFALPWDITAAEGLERLRIQAQEESIYYIYCVNEGQQLVGVISLRALATAPSETPLKNLIKRDVVTVSPETSEEEVARTVAHYDFVAIPVIDETRRLLGIITVDDVVDVIQQQATANLYARAGLQEDDRVYSSAMHSIQSRLPWMFLNLLLAALASSVVSLFEKTMSQLIILASLKNIVAGTGGNTAIQSLTVVTRGLATDDFSFISRAKAVLKETSVGLVIGCFTGLGAAILTYFWKGSALVAVVIFISMVLNSLVATFFGALLPIALKKLNWDPAVGSGVLVTMITDTFGFFSFLGIASLGLHLVGHG